MKQIKESKVLIVGLVKNAAGTISAELSKLNIAFKSFKDVQFLLIESDSTDSTIDELIRVKQYEINNLKHIALGRLSAMLPKRTERLAHCRNQYLKEIRENKQYSDIDYVAIADLDGVNQLLTEEAVNSCWDWDGWDVCTANQLGPYYDIWALRHPIWSPNDCWEQCRFLEHFGISHEHAKQAAVYSKQIIIPQTSGWIEVDSAFGGIAIYKRSALEQGHYSGIGVGGEEACDHPFLHKTIRANGGKIFINPKLINTNITEHTQHHKVKSKLLYL